MSVTLVGAYCLMKTRVVYTAESRVFTLKESGQTSNVLIPEVNEKVNTLIEQIKVANEDNAESIKTILIKVVQMLSDNGQSSWAEIHVSFLLKSEVVEKMLALNISSCFAFHFDYDTGMVWKSRGYPFIPCVNRTGVVITEDSRRAVKSPAAILKAVKRSSNGYLVRSILKDIKRKEDEIAARDALKLLKQKWANKVESLVNASLASMKSEVANSLGVDESTIEKAVSHTHKGNMSSEVLVEHHSNNVRVRLRKTFRGDWDTGDVISDEAKWEFDASSIVTKNALAKLAGVSIL